MPKIYPTDLNDAEWAVLAPLLEPPTRRGRPRTHDRRLIVNAVLYVLRGGIAWRLLPQPFPPWTAVYDHLRRWRRAGVWRRINDALRARARTRAGRNPQPTAAIIDSQTVRTSGSGGERGYDGGKRISGRCPPGTCSVKRHLVVDTQGFLVHARVHAANLHGRRAAERVLDGLNKAHPEIEVLFADMGYQGLEPWSEATLGWRLIIVKRPAKWVFRAGRCTAASLAFRLPRPAQALDRGANLRLVDAKPAPDEGLGATEHDQRNLDLPRHEPAHGKKARPSNA